VEHVENQQAGAHDFRTDTIAGNYRDMEA